MKIEVEDKKKITPTFFVSSVIGILRSLISTYGMSREQVAKTILMTDEELKEEIRRRKAKKVEEGN
jgi:hypothetical protein